jgi:hypothetical protein
MPMRIVSSALLLLVGCQYTADTSSHAPGSAAAPSSVAPAIVQDLVWGGTNYDVRHVDKERFLSVLRTCWFAATKESPGSAGMTRVDLQIDRQGSVIDEAVSVALFQDLFAGPQDVEAEAAYLQCAERGFHKLVVPPASGDGGTLFFDARLLPARTATRR